MKLGVFTVLFQKLPFERMIERVAECGLEAVEIGTGAYPGNAHCNLDALVASPRLAAEYRKTIESAGLIISALACQGNPLHPNPAVAGAHDAAFEKTLRLAELMEVPVINLLSGCPGDSPTAKYPNWVASAWPPDYPELLDWQWNEVAIPYWKKAAERAATHGVTKLAVEMHPGFLVYNPETALRLRREVGPALGVNFDPSHLFWLGIEMPQAIRALGDSIFHVHAKDCAVDPANVAVNGCLDHKPYARMLERAWSFRTVGWGHGMQTWRDIVSALRMSGYDYVLSIEHEDALASPEEGLAHAVKFLKECLLTQPAGEMWWA